MIDTREDREPEGAPIEEPVKFPRRRSRSPRNTRRTQPLKAEKKIPPILWQSRRSRRRTRNLPR